MRRPPPRRSCRPGHPVRVAAVVAVVVALPAVGAGCTQGGGVDAGPTTASTSTAAPATTRAPGAGLGKITPGAAADFLAAAAEQTAKVATGSFTFTMALVDNPTLGSGEQPLATIQGTFDRKQDQSRLEMDLATLATLAPEALASGNQDKATRQVLTRVLQDPLVIVTDGGEQYLRSTSLAKLLGKGRPWVRSTGGSGGLPLGDLGIFDVQDLQGFLGTLRAAGSVKEKGHEDVAGTDTTHYRGTVDLAELHTSGSRSGGLLGELGTSGAVTVDLWIDGDGMMRRLRIEGEPSILRSTVRTDLPASAAVITIELADLGQPVTIEVPAPSDVTDLLESGTTGTSIAAFPGRPG